MILVTGAAGFIGSNIATELNEAGRSDLVLCDLLRQDGKWHNLRKRAFADLVPPAELFDWLATPAGGRISAVVHMGANSSTLAVDGDEVMQRNFRFSLRLLDWCAAAGVPFIYASSAATYGDGAAGYDDDSSFTALRRLQPRNLYGWSKHAFDLALVARRERGEALPPLCIGLKFFNVYGPNEGHKGTMQSVARKLFTAITEGRPVTLFRSHNPAYADGMQMRDFVYVRDICAVIRHLLAQPSGFGILNVGAGAARTWLDLARSVFAALGRPPEIGFIEMPEALRGAYQYHTEADIGRLRRFGFNADMTGLEAGVADYVTRYLTQADSFR